MSGFTVALNKRHRCEASGKEYTRFLRRGVPNAHGMMNCPLCNKGVTLKGVSSFSVQ